LSATHAVGAANSRTCVTVDKQETGVSQLSTDVFDTDGADVATRPVRRPQFAARTLASADAAAARGDYVEALAWLRSLDAIGYELDPVYANRRAEWRSKVETRRVGSSQWFG
jgi:hypothetical protein